MKPNPTDITYVIVTEKPNRVYVAINKEIHTARWRTSDNKNCLYDATGNYGILNAAMMAWSGQSHFTTTFAKLELAASGWGAWTE